MPASSRWSHIETPVYAYSVTHVVEQRETPVYAYSITHVVEQRPVPTSINGV